MFLALLFSLFISLFLSLSFSLFHNHTRSIVFALSLYVCGSFSIPRIVLSLSLSLPIFLCVHVCDCVCVREFEWKHEDMTHTPAC